MIVIGKEYVAGILDKGMKPAAVCDSGETVVFETRDCYDDSVVSEEQPLGDKENPIENPATGPLFVKGALAGDVLKVEILDIPPVTAGGIRRNSFPRRSCANHPNHRVQLQVQLPVKRKFPVFSIQLKNPGSAFRKVLMKHPIDW